MWRDATKPHTVDIDELRAYMAQERWETIASSSFEPKRIEASSAHAFRVTVRDAVMYAGPSLVDAVRAYNEAQ